MHEREEWRAIGDEVPLLFSSAGTMALGRAQTKALEHVAAAAGQVRDDARAKIVAILARNDESADRVERLVPWLREHIRVTVNFHPDRLRSDGLTVAEGLHREGRYRNQFETGVTNGSPTAFRGGDRDRWEERLFGGAYQEPEGSADERPKYGALNLMCHADGASPRFGSCYLELRPIVTSRCSLTWGDSHDGPEHIGTIDVFEPIALALLETVESKREALGVSKLDVSSIIDLLSSLDERAARHPTERSLGRALDAYIEAQVHGAIDLATDVERVVIDPAFEATRTGELLRALASKCGIALCRHPGFVLSPAEVPPDFRGPRMVPLAARISTEFGAGEELDASVLGRAAEALHRDPGTWSDWGTPQETWQHIKQLWHVLVRFGRVRRGRSPAQPVEIAPRTYLSGDEDRIDVAR